MKTESLVGPANIREQTLGKLAYMRWDNLTEKQKMKIANLERTLFHCFDSLVWKYFGIDHRQTLELSDDEINVLFNLIYRRAKKTSVLMKILGYGIPVVGWFLILDTSMTIPFVNSTRELEKMLGNTLNPAKIIRTYITRLKTKGG